MLQPLEETNNKPGQTSYRRITIQDAINTALGEIPDEVTKIGRESKNDILVYEVDNLSTHGSKYEVTIDTNTGEILKTETEKNN
ncbi:PepSY domain-containing protein [Oceanobacillus sp. CFH 90083]|uniref:PepSY domain-containing protein n=1 Tax=Oceanobacillus sp. CFH 90083 TaxID=2592336 RepID=UPI00128B0138|nr:PepSY domain-containing protein [Oceanobacillus sp. CFH 90083]